jgi:DNA modification methylase
MPQAVVYLADSRAMPEVATESVGLVVTSPPYWHLKDYGAPNQIGYGQSLHEYLYDLARVWQECWRVLQHGRRLCINIGDQFARAAIYGNYKVIPLHAEIIAQCETIGFDYLGAIIWQKKTTMRPSGGAVIMGSYPYPPNGIVELDYEYILIFRKPGKGEAAPLPVREASALTRDEWKTYFSGHWQFAGERQVHHEAMFPEELPKRLIRMFSFVGDTVLDPFVGSGTTLKVALELNRNALGYEIQPEFVPIIREKLMGNLLLADCLQIHLRETFAEPVAPLNDYAPRIKDAYPTASVKPQPQPEGDLCRIVRIAEDPDLHLLTDDGRRLSLLGVVIPPEQRLPVREYLLHYVVGKRVIVRLDDAVKANGTTRPVYVYLTNRLFVNRKMIEMGLAQADRSRNYRYRRRFEEVEEKNGW